MARNLTRSSSGVRSSSARSSSRAPNSSHDSSRLENRSGPQLGDAASAVVRGGRRWPASSPVASAVGAAASEDGSDAGHVSQGYCDRTCRAPPPCPAVAHGPEVPAWRRAPSSRLDPGAFRLLRRRARLTAGRGPGRPNPRRRTELGLLILGALIVVATYVLAVGRHHRQDPRRPGSVPGHRARAGPGRPHRQPVLRPGRQPRPPPPRRPAERARLRHDRPDRPAPLRHGPGRMDGGRAWAPTSSP